MEKVKVGAVGDWLVGKTSLLIAYTENNFPTDHIPRVYDQSEKEIKVTVDGEEVALELWDTVACVDYDRLRALLFYPGTDVFLLCYSVCSVETLKNIHSRWAPEVRLIDNFFGRNSNLLWLQIPSFCGIFRFKNFLFSDSTP